MTGPERHIATVTVVVRCGFIGCDWSIEIGSAPLEAHNAYLDHLDVHDVEVVDLRKADCDQEDGEDEDQPAAPYAGIGVTHRTPDSEHLLEPGCCQFNPAFLHAGDPTGLYVGDSAAEIAAEQARVDRFMAGGNDA